MSTNSYWNFFNFRRNLIKKLSRKNNIFLLANNDIFKKYFKNKKVKLHNSKLQKNNISFFSDLNYLLNYLNIIKKINPKVIISFTVKPNIYTLIMSKLFRIPVILTVTGLGTLFINHKFYSKIYLFFFKLFLSKKVVIFFHNKDDYNLFKHNNLLIKALYSKVINGSGVDFTRFKKHKLNLKKTNFLFVGRLIKDKGVEELIESINFVKKKYKDVNFRIIGEYDSKNPRSIDKDNYHKIKMDKINYNSFTANINNYYKNSSCLILPSWREGLSKTMIEAMYCGLPFITTNVPGCSAIAIKSKGGLICKVKNNVSLQNEIIKFINFSVSKKKLLSKNAHNYAKKNFNENQIHNEYINAIKKFKKK